MIRKRNNTARSVTLALILAGLSFGTALQARAQVTPEHAGHVGGDSRAIGTRAITPAQLPPLPANLPGWIRNERQNEVSYTRGKYNFNIYYVPELAKDLNATGVGHSFAYEDLVTGKAKTLETKTFDRIDWVLKHQPKYEPTEKMIMNTFARRYGVLEQVFDVTHLMHAQTVDVLVNPKMTWAEKEREIERIYQVYRTTIPYAITSLPMNMGYLWGQPYSRRFYRNYPKVNGLFWGYHWLQTTMYDALYGKSLAEQKKVYDTFIAPRYRTLELYKTDRLFMPMTAETSPRFAARFPDIANVFDNLHMLHDMVNDILVSDDLTQSQKDEQITRAIWLVMERAHEDEKPGTVGEGGKGGLHDHRFMEGMPGMGLMPDMEPDQMFMPGFGWMSMSECHHCSMPLPEGKDAWRVSTVTAQGVTMRARCALCARDYALETPGASLMHLFTEDPEKPVTILLDEQGNATTTNKGVVFLEQEDGHAGCSEWSQAFTSRTAFDTFVAANPEYKGAKALTLDEWLSRQGKKPDTYFKREGKPGNPFDGQSANSEAKP